MAANVTTAGVFVICQDLENIARLWFGHEDDEGHWCTGFAGDGETWRAVAEHRQTCRRCLANDQIIAAWRQTRDDE